MSDAKVLGRFVWHELLTTDVEAGMDFYSKVVGWKAQGWENDPSYRMFVAAEGPVAGCMTLPEDAKAMGAPPHWMTYIGTPDVDATASDAESLGATILRAPADIPGAGRFAVIQDPQGAVFAIYGSPPGSPAPSDAPPAVGDFSWHELITTDLDAAWEFYSRLFGWNKTSAMDMGAMGIYQMYGFGDVPLGGIYVKPPEMPAPPHWMPYAKVRDTHQAVESAKDLGATIMHGPMEVPGGDFVALGRDLQGAHFAVHSAAPVVKAVPPGSTSAKDSARYGGTKPRAKKAKKAARKPARKAAKKTAKRGAKKAAKKRGAMKKAGRKKAGRKKATRKSARKAARKGARKGARKSARQSARRPTRKKAAARGRTRRPARRKKK